MSISHEFALRLTHILHAKSSACQAVDEIGALAGHILFGGISSTSGGSNDCACEIQSHAISAVLGGADIVSPSGIHRAKQLR